VSIGRPTPIALLGATQELWPLFCHCHAPAIQTPCTHHRAVEPAPNLSVVRGRRS
jgi:hypothetical protein